MRTSLWATRPGSPVVIERPHERSCGDQQVAAQPARPGIMWPSLGKDERRIALSLPESPTSEPCPFGEFVADNPAALPDEVWQEVLRRVAARITEAQQCQ